MSRAMQLDLLSAFAASAGKVAAYAAISSLLLAGGTAPADFAIFTLIRSTLGLVNYATVGLAPAFIREMASLASAGQTQDRLRRLYASAQYPAMAIGVVALLILAGYAVLYNHVHKVPAEVIDYAPASALLVGMAMLMRLISDIPGGYLQATRRITLDNLLLLSADLCWPIVAWVLIRQMPSRLLAASLSFFICYAALGVCRFIVARAANAPVGVGLREVELPTARRLLSFGVLLTFSQLADFLYAPASFLLINWFLVDPKYLADYSIAVQLDAAMLLLATAVYSVLYPRAAGALARKDHQILRRYYWRGTVLTFVLMALGAGVLLLIAKPLLLLWLKADSPGAREVLPLLMIHSVVGGSSSAGRAILLAAGKAWVFASAAIAAGGLNVVLCLIFLRYSSMGLTGVILATIITVVLRCGIWMPWYTLRTMRKIHAASDA